MLWGFGLCYTKEGMDVMITKQKDTSKDNHAKNQMVHYSDRCTNGVLADIQRMSFHASTIRTGIAYYYGKNHAASFGRRTGRLALAGPYHGTVAA